MPSCRHTEALADFTASLVQEAYTRAGFPGLTSLIGEVAAGPGCRGGLPSLPQSHGAGVAAPRRPARHRHRRWGAAHTAPRRVARSQALPAGGPALSVPGWSTTHLQGCARRVRASLGQNKGRGHGRAGMFGPGTTFSNALFMTTAGKSLAWRH